MTVTYFIFYLSLAILLFCYIIYGLLLFVLNVLKKPFIRKKGPVELPGYPAVTLIVAAYNEGPDLRQKLENTLAIDYPPDKLKVIFVTDGSTDGSEKVIHEHARVTLLHQPERQGKAAAVTRAMEYVQTPIVIFSDANAMLNKECVRRIVAHYADERTGGVAGEKKIANVKDGPAIGEAEGLYWHYESFMKKQEDGFNTVVGAAGELFSIRTRLFDPPAKDILLDDFVISLRICLKGYKIRYEPGAFATELPSASLQEETKRKIRIAAGAYQSIGYLKECLNFFKHPLLSFQYISRRLLRWVFCPWMLITLLLSTIIIVAEGSAPVFYTWVLFVQLFFYLAALLGGWLIRFNGRIGIIAVPFYFLFMNYCVMRGFIRFLKKDQTVLWERSVRQVGG
jgi:biofilm PGA synthesis N-glycosyltransferase PgaC